MDKEDKETLLFRIDNEGFDYCFRFYSRWKEIKDNQFHELLNKYIDAANALDDYINNDSSNK